MSPNVNVDIRETDKFSALAAEWWDLHGPMHTLHAVNPLRTGFIRDSCELRGRTVIDIGCGGGVLAESLTNLGAHVTGLDLSSQLLGIARAHAQQEGLTIDYREVSAEQLADEQPGRYDVVTCLEVLEHVPHPDQLVMAASKLLKPGGHAFFATIDRNLKALLFVIIGAEYVLGLLQRGTHHYGGFIRPGELKSWGARAGMQHVRTVFVLYNMLTRKFSLTDRRDDVYIMHLRKGSSA